MVAAEAETKSATTTPKHQHQHHQHGDRGYNDALDVADGGGDDGSDDGDDGDDGDTPVDKRLAHLRLFGGDSGGGSSRQHGWAGGGGAGGTPLVPPPPPPPRFGGAGASEDADDSINEFFDDSFEEEEDDDDASELWSSVPSATSATPKDIANGSGAGGVGIDSGGGGGKETVADYMKAIESGLLRKKKQQQQLPHINVIGATPSPPRLKAATTTHAGTYERGKRGTSEAGAGVDKVGGAVAAEEGDGGGSGDGVVLSSLYEISNSFFFLRT